MYTYIKAIGLSRSLGSQWEEEALADILVYGIYQNFTKVILVLNNSILQAEVFVDMDDLRAEFSSYNQTLSTLLTELGDRALPTTQFLPSTAVKFAKYTDAVRAEYKVKPCIAGRIVPENYPESELKDLSLTRPKYKTNMKLVEDYCLVSVNGYYHQVASTDNEAFVYEGAVTMRHSKLNHLGILSFYDIGKLTKINIDPVDIKPETPDNTLRDKINFTVSEDLDNKSYILILGGYIVLPQENVFWRSGQNGFTLDIKRLNYKERILESIKYIDLKPLGLTNYPIGDNVLSVEELYSDEVIKKYMTLSQSFLVLVDTPNLVSNKINLRHSSLPGMFTSYQEPVYPLIVNYGKVAEYWKILEDGYWSVTVQDSYLRNFIASQQPTKNEQAITDSLSSVKPFYHGRGFLLELSGWKNS